jgi:sugar lactone lactonase YvrE
MLIEERGVECVVRDNFLLGEGPLWNARDESIWWVDILGPAIHRLTPATGARATWTMPASIGSFVFRPGGDLVVGLRSGFQIFDPQRYKEGTGALTMIAAPEADKPKNRPNDGKCDRDGRYWCGTMIDGGMEPTGSLYRIDRDRSCRKFLDGIKVPNSIAFAPDGKTMYFADTREGSIRAYAYDRAAGTLGAMRVLAAPGHAPGSPDGSTIDADGCLWSARYGGGMVVRIAPDGRVDRAIRLPVTQITAAAFGGPKLDTLYITTAAQRLAPEELARQPLAGALFAVRPGVSGLPEADFAG